MTIAQITLPPKLVPQFSKPLGSYRYRGAYGGRGGGKSRNYALMAAVFGFVDPLRILCTREFHTSMRESFHAELRQAIDDTPWLQGHYDVGVDYIRGKNGTEFIFRGLRNSIGSIKSTAGIDLTIVEEAEDVPEESWLALEATVFRNNKSELWPLWNPRNEGTPVDLRFRKNPPPNSTIIEINWYDNPFFPDALNELRVREQQRLDPATYAWIWEGAYNTKSDAQVFNGKFSMEEFTPGDDWDGPYFGADWGFAQDPTTLVKMWLHDDTLYIEHELYRIGLEITDTPQAFRTIPGADTHTIRADNARPETISHCKNAGLKILPAIKGRGSVEGGIMWLRGLKNIVIHPRCQNTYEEFRLYSHKVDRLTGDVLADVVDTDNHAIDAIRYALEPLIRGKKKNNLIYSPVSTKGKIGNFV